MITQHINTSGPRPIVRDLAFGLWGNDANFDADGDASHPDDQHWNRLMLCLRRKDEESGFSRNDETQRIEITVQAAKSGNVISIHAPSEALADRVAQILLGEHSV
ncbi:MAG: hypothetical protein AAFO73_09600 [Pseudomonadota bacterium]